MKPKTDIMLLAASAVLVGTSAAFAVHSQRRTDEVTVTVMSSEQTAVPAETSAVQTEMTKQVTVKQTTARAVTTTEAVTTATAETAVLTTTEAEPPNEPETEHVLTLEEAAPININTADIGTLMLLPHVDEEIAWRIIELREAIGGYSHVYELLYIDELEQKEVSEIVDFVTVGQ